MGADMKEGPGAWLIRKDGYFYRPDCSGYTTRKDEAGRYTEAEAKREASVEPWHMSAILADDVPDPPYVADKRDAEIRHLSEEVERLKVRAETAEARVKVLEGDHSDFGPETIKIARELELSGISGEMVDAVAAAIRADGSDLCDGAWSAVPEMSKAGWREDAIRALAALVKMRPVVKEYLTPAECGRRAALSHKEGGGMARARHSSRPVTVQGMSDDTLMQVAHILGASSAAARAIEERDRRRAEGENVVVLWDSDRGVLLVGPPVADGEEAL